ncbi:phage tail protein [Serratia sp. MF2]|uniref:phage tail protein n=1 Tax=Serratia sp. MF1(2023) TaxID=3059171 RepID=UPI0027FE30BA|nr:phage tail protein [Serratia sp. MF1(2023)]MDQ7104216.1 phage tail protein [Serratia sp. MF1(2023)]
MAISDILGISASSLAGMALGNLSTLGSIGDIVFQVNPYKVKTFEALSRTSAINFADHEVAGRKPASEMTGEALDEIDLRIVLNSGLGVSPRSEANNLRSIMSSGEPQQLVIGTSSLGQFTIRTISEEWNHITSAGTVMLIALDIHLVEYVATVPTQAQQIMTEDSIRRSETGKGGPDKLPGSFEATKTRTLTPVKS